MPDTSLERQGAKSLMDVLAKYKKSFQSVLPAHLTPERWTWLAVNSIRPGIKMISAEKKIEYWVARLAGHNTTTFDVPRLRAAFGTSFFPASYHSLDTLQRALWYFYEHPEIERPASLKLSTLCQFFGIDCTGAHDALADVRMAAALIRAFRAAEREGHAKRHNQT